MILSVLGSAGFFSAIGLKSTLIIMEVIPFLVLAVSSLIGQMFCFYCFTFKVHFCITKVVALVAYLTGTL